MVQTYQGQFNKSHHCKIKSQTFLEVEHFIQNVVVFLNEIKIGK